jgi:hypothetical protein
MDGQGELWRAIAGAESWESALRTALKENWSYAQLQGLMDKRSFHA